MEHPVCDVCSRTLLKGEELHEYVSSQGERFGVCVLCRSRAEASGWIPAEQYGTITHEPPSRSRRGLALRRRLAGAAERARAGARSARAATKRDPARESGPAEDRSEGEAAEADPEAGAQPAPAAELQAVSPRSPQPRRGPEAIMRGAVESFNSSEESRKVAGLIRSLGEPQAAVCPDPPRQLALVTVAWELSWYQWEVGANGDDDSVREVAKGDEVAELAEEARTWNASVDEDGKLQLRATRKRPQATASEA